eukprot:TRINITY_DN29544_c0_g1_i1.p1 TRINITY_DN29544_c0_g1~~TRINITY_DN29544_c0_g1_i1.p1  ORF type:complete len:491 (+),score=17.83 TRINITY_DN29544_c0_g1_i1:2-1474(+)
MSKSDTAEKQKTQRAQENKKLSPKESKYRPKTKSEKKGHQVVVMNTIDYDHRILVLLQDKTIYRKLYFNPFSRHVDQTTKLISNLRQNPNINQEFLNLLVCQRSKPPSIYCLPKLHKKGIPFRPIIASINSPDYHISKHLTYVLLPLVRSNPFSIINLHDFVKFVQNQRLLGEEIMVNLDVKAMFTSIPVEEAISQVMQLVNNFPSFSERTLLTVDQFERLLRFTSTSTYFQYRGNYFEQVKGLPMGKPSSPALSNLFMEKTEKQIFKSCKCLPRIWQRYQDDIFIVVDRNKIEQLLKELNQIHRDIKFIFETEENGQLNFLDVSLIRAEGGQIKTKVFRRFGKENFRTLDFESYHEHCTKKGTAKSLFIQAKNYSSDDKDAVSERKNVRQILKTSNYPQKLINQLEKQAKEHRKKKSSKSIKKLNINELHVGSIEKWNGSKKEKQPIIQLPYIDTLNQSFRKTGQKYGFQVCYQQKPLGKVFQRSTRAI